MLSYKEILEDKLIINEYEKVDMQNEYPFNHGMQHIKNVIEIIQKISIVLNISKKEESNLLIAAALHDIGQATGREKHGLKAKNFAKEYLNEKIDKVDLDIILQAIEFHSDINKMSELPLFSNIICFSDKMDFSRKRLEKNYEEKFGYIVCENITDIVFDYDGKLFVVNILVQGITDEKATELLIEKHSFSKSVQVIVELSKKLNVNYEIYIGKLKLDLSKLKI